jgi:DNA primase
VAVPLGWDELDTAEPDGWTVRTIGERLEKVADPWAGMARRARTLDRAREWLARES